MIGCNNTPTSPHAKEYIYRDSFNQEKQPLKLEDLKEGVVLVNEIQELIVQGVMKELVFCIDKNQSAKTRSIHQLIRANYTIKQPEPVEEWIPEVGEWFTCIRADLEKEEVQVRGAGWKNNLTFKATKIEKWYETVSIVFGGVQGSGVYSHSIRKALPYEIPQEHKHYLGFPIGDYTGKNIIVEFDIWDSRNIKTYDILREVKECEFITEKYRTVEAKLAPCNNHEFKLLE